MASESTFEAYLLTNAKLATELSRLDPTVPFRAATHHVHHTWARTFYSRPELYVRPRSLPEIQKTVTLARRCRRRIVVVGSGHSPSSLTCSSSWMVNLDDFAGVVSVDAAGKSMVFESGIRLRDANRAAGEHGLTIPSLGSIDEQSIAGAIATGTHGSSLRHGTLGSYVLSLRIVLANGSVVRCSPRRNPDLFRAALVSLGGLGIVVEVEYQMVPDRRLKWSQTTLPLDELLARWETDLWTSHEFVRVWWMPYTRRAVVWRAGETVEQERSATGGSWYGNLVGYQLYKSLLTLAHYVPRVLPWIEWFVFGMQYGFRIGHTSSGVQVQREGLLMDCLYSQFVNEWALPLGKGPEAIRRLDAWFNNIPHSDDASDPLPYPNSKGIFVHAPIEVRVANTSDPKVSPRPRGFLDMSCKDTPTLYLNATLYRPYGLDPPCRTKYYNVFEACMRKAGGRPHWAKNFSEGVSAVDVEAWYGADLEEWRKQRRMVDPDGVFVGGWLRHMILGRSSITHDQFSADQPDLLPCEEKALYLKRIPLSEGGGVEWGGACTYKSKSKADFGEEDSVAGTEKFIKGSRTGSSSEESFDHFAAAEVEASVWMENKDRELEDGEDEETE